MGNSLHADFSYKPTIINKTSFNIMIVNFNCYRDLKSQQGVSEFDFRINRCEFET